MEDTEELEDDSEGSLSTKRSTVVLSSIVDYDHYPGLYTLRSVIFRTVGGQNIRILALTSRLYDDSEGEATFWIEEEPTEVDPITAEVEPDPAPRTISEPSLAPGGAGCSEGELILGGW